MRSFRSFGVLVLAFLLLAGVMPAGAWGAVTLTWERNWGSLDFIPPYENGMFNGAAGDVAVDKWDRVYVTGGEGDYRIQQFTSGGTFVKLAPTLSPPVAGPVGIGTDRWGNVYVSDKNMARRDIRVFGENLWDGGYLPWDDLTNHITNPLRLDVGLDGTLYLVDNGSVVQRWGWSGTYLNEFSRVGTHIYEGVGVSDDGYVYVANRKYHMAPPPDVLEPDRIFKFGTEGGYLSQWGGTGAAHGQLAQVNDVDVDPLGNVYVADSDNNRIEVFDANGAYLATAGGTSGPGDQQFLGVRAIGLGSDRTVYAVDNGNARISKWKVNVPTAVDQVAGGSRITTAIEASKKAYPDGATTVVLATAANWPDALGGAALCGQVKGPLLLVNKDTLPAEVALEIDRLNARYVYVLGGTGVVSDAVFNAAKALTPLNAGERLGGANRYETAILIAREVKQLRGSDYDGTAFICTGADFPDALAAAPISAANGWPIYLTPPAALPANVRAALLETWGGNPSNHGYIVGGEAAVSPEIEVELSTPPFVDFGRFSGDNRYETAAELAEISWDGMGMVFSRPAIATGENFPDALAGGVLQGSDYSPLLLTRSGTLHIAVADLLAKHKDEIYEMRFIGGNTAVTPAVQNAAKALLW